MSLYTITSSFLSIGPHIKVEPALLTVKDNVFLRTLRLFYSSRHTVIDSNTQMVTIHERSFWFKTQTYELSFDEIDHIDYDGQELWTSYGSAPTLGNVHGMQATDAIEKYTIALVAKDEGFYSICSYVGEGSAHTGIAGVFIGGDDIFDASGTQQEDSRMLTTHLTQRIGVPIGKQHDLSAMPTITCPSCNREVAVGKPRCLYCGAETMG